MPRHRFTLRWMIVAVAIVAAILGTYVGLRKRSDLLHQKGLAHLRDAQRAADTAWGFQRFDINPDGSVPEAQARQATRYWGRHMHHQGLGE